MRITNTMHYQFIHATGISLDKSSITLNTVGQTEQLTATVTPADSTDIVTWSSSDTSIATVDQTGLVTCVTPGECTITATCGGYSATCGVINGYYNYTTASQVTHTGSNTQYYYGVGFEPLVNCNIKEIGFLYDFSFPGDLEIVRDGSSPVASYTLDDNNTAGGKFVLPTQVSLQTGHTYRIDIKASDSNKGAVGVSSGGYPIICDTIKYTYGWYSYNGGTTNMNNLYNIRYILTD